MKIDVFLEKGIAANYLGEKILYLELVNLKNLKIKYGLASNGWLIEDDQDIINVAYDSENYMPFVKMLQAPIEDIISSIKAKCDMLQIKDMCIEDLFPIKNITMTVLKMESNYWSRLAIEYLIYLQINDPELKKHLDNYLLVKWPSQLVKKLIKRYTQQCP